MRLGDLGKVMLGRPPSWAARHPWRYVAMDMLLLGLLVWVALTIVFAITGGPRAGAVWAAAGGMVGRLIYHRVRRNGPSGGAGNAPEPGDASTG